MFYVGIDNHCSDSRDLNAIVLTVQNSNRPVTSYSISWSDEPTIGLGDSAFTGLYYNIIAVGQLKTTSV